MTFVLTAKLLLMSFACLPLAARVTTANPSANPEAVTESLQATEKPDTCLDPTVQTSKLGLQNYFGEPPYAAYLYQLILKGTYAFGCCGKSDCSLSVALPAVVHFSQ